MYTAPVRPTLNVDVEHERLPNGMTIMFVPGRMYCEFAAKLVFPVGVKDEPKGKNGLRTLTFFAMTSPQTDIARTAERAGLWFDPLNIQHPMTALDLVGDRNNIEVAFAVYASLFDDKRMSEENVTTTRSFLTEYVKKKPGSARGALDILYEGTPLEEKDNVGRAQDVASLTRDDVLWFRNTFLNPSNAMLCIIGDFDREKTRALIQQYFGQLPASLPPPPTQWNLTPLSGPQTVTYEKGKKGEYQVVVAYETPGADTVDDRALTLLDALVSNKIPAMLKGKFSKDPSAIVAGWRQQWGPSWFRFAAVLNADELDAAERALLECVDALKNGGFTQEDLDHAKNDITQGVLLYCGNSPYHSSWWYPAPFRPFYDVKLEHVDKFNDIQNLTVDDVAKCARKYFTEQRRHTVRIRPEPQPTATAPSRERDY